jgi:hypothetical protein
LEVGGVVPRAVLTGRRRRRRRRRMGVVVVIGGFRRTFWVCVPGWFVEFGFVKVLAPDDGGLIGRGHKKAVAEVVC